MSADREALLRELAAVSESIRAITSSLEPEEVLRLVLQRIKTLTQAEALSLLLHDPIRNELVFSATEALRGGSFSRLRAGEPQGVEAFVLRTGRSVRANDPAELRALGLTAELLAAGARGLLAVPVRCCERVAGVLRVDDRYDGGEFTTDDEARLEALAEELAGCRDPAALACDDEALQTLFSRIAATVPSEDVSLLLIDSEGRQRVLGVTRELSKGVIDGVRMPVGRGIAGWVAENRRALRLDHVRSDPRYWSGLEERTGLVPETMLCVPLVMRERLLGVIQLLNKLDGSPFTEDELRLVQTLADHAAVAIENASLYREARRAALTDDLTGLANARHFNERLPELIARGAPLALVVIDLDHFKAVVDRHGHLVGSRTLGQIGRRIAATLRPGDFAARFGGDEFVVILRDTRADDALARAGEIRDAIAAVECLDGTDVDLSGVTASIGVACFPDHAASAEELFHRADQAMYSVKGSGRNAVALASNYVQAPA
ncbi:Response regulator PleD [Myxococcaceae bacterium]|jgi:diguanylate cyclase (GGDEF)-like protein|nr:Response regulator PleD [Myxococcaceae bacterium]